MAMANKYNLMITGGSDFHGIEGRMPKNLGEFSIEDSYAAEIYREPNI